jgi:hypothetical protein
MDYVNSAGHAAVIFHLLPGQESERLFRLTYFFHCHFKYPALHPQEVLILRPYFKNFRISADCKPAGHWRLVAVSVR